MGRNKVEASRDAWQGAAGQKVVMLSEPLGPQAEGIRALRTNLVAQHLGSGCRALAVCSPEPDVGKTFTAVNLAVALAQVDVNVLLIDADLRSPGVKAYFSEASSAPGLAEWLQGSGAPAAGVGAQPVLPHLSLITSGVPVAAPQELVASKRFRELLDYTTREYDFTIVDTPAASAYSDTRDIAAAVRHAIIIGGKDVSSVRNIQILTEQLRIDGCSLLGYVLNGA